VTAPAPVTIVTGAGSGIGRAIAHRLNADGHRLTLVGRRESALAETAAGVDTVMTVAGDLAEEDTAARVVDATVQKWGRLDAIVNNAGVAEPAMLAETTTERLRRVFEINVHGPARLITAAWPVFVEQGGGSVVNITSMAVVDPFPGLAIYAASKSALDSLTRSIRNEGAEHGIHAWSVAPGAVETDMLRTVVTEDQLPADQTLDPGDIATIVADCLSGKASEPSGGSILVPSG
jgi:NAD(P)-dependent dehydrogenase (short-subunit alcohol dehydrogenase family)